MDVQDCATRKTAVQFLSVKPLHLVRPQRTQLNVPEHWVDMVGNQVEIALVGSRSQAMNCNLLHIAIEEVAEFDLVIRNVQAITDLLALFNQPISDLSLSPGRLAFALAIRQGNLGLPAAVSLAVLD